MKICLLGFFSIYSLILGHDKGGERKHVNSTCLHLAFVDEANSVWLLSPAVHREALSLISLDVPPPSSVLNQRCY